MGVKKAARRLGGGMKYLLVLLLTGCATYTPQELAQMARQDTSPQLCYTSMVTNSEAVKAAANAELSMRGHSCSQFTQEIQLIMQVEAHKRANEIASSENMTRAMEMIRQSRGTPAPRTQTNCTSRRVGGSIETSCW